MTQPYRAWPQPLVLCYAGRPREGQASGFLEEKSLSAYLAGCRGTGRDSAASSRTLAGVIHGEHRDHDVPASYGWH